MKEDRYKYTHLNVRSGGYCFRRLAEFLDFIGRKLIISFAYDHRIYGLGEYGDHGKNIYTCFRMKIENSDGRDTNLGSGPTLESAAENYILNLLYFHPELQLHSICPTIENPSRVISTKNFFDDFEVKFEGARRELRRASKYRHEWHPINHTLVCS